MLVWETVVRGFPGGSVVRNSPVNAGGWGDRFNPRSERSLGVGNGMPLNILALEGNSWTEELVAYNPWSAQVGTHFGFLGYSRLESARKGNWVSVSERGSLCLHIFEFIVFWSELSAEIGRRQRAKAEEGLDYKCGK